MSDFTTTQASKLCKDCVYMDLDNDERKVCTHPKSRSTGGGKARLAIKMRGMHGPCRPRGIFWEAL